MQISQSLKIIILCLIVGFGLNYATAWVGPVGSAPGGNISAPVNVSATSQYKTGALGIGGILSAYSGIQVSNVVTAWGACSPNGTIGITSDGFLAVCSAALWTPVAMQTAP